jgi:hypothetical protein
MPWIAFRHTMDRDELKANNFEDWANIPLNWQPAVKDRKDVPDDLKKAEVFEIWCKDDAAHLDCEGLAQAAADG